MPTGQAPHPGYFDEDALDFSVAIVETILGAAGHIFGAV